MMIEKEERIKELIEKLEQACCIDSCLIIQALREAI